ncbi:MAG: nucleotidyltransferase domain-containing protein [Candidatus Aminicenantes bacterium]|nr:nucleotidyltransferase domain-containing protein [Candidatus Aminicenantes bacterium]
MVRDVFSTATLDRALKKKRAEREKFRRKRTAEVLAALETLSRDVAFEEAILFGSLTRKGKYSEDSDIDIGFVGLADKDFFRAQAFLSRALDADVDVVQVEKCGRLKDKIREEGVRWKRRDGSS